MIQVLDDARDRLDDARGALKGLSREAARRTGDGAQLLTELSRAAVKQADNGAHYALERARSDRVSWTMVAGALGVGFVTAFALLNSKKAANTAATAMIGDWYEGLTGEHARMEKLFKQIVATSDAQTAKRTRLLEALNALLTRHALQKENVLYPALRATDQGASSMHLAAELFEIKTYLYELEALPKEDPRWLRKAKALQKLVQEHIEAEEQVLPGFHEGLSAADGQRLTKAMHREALKLA
jgi:Hemerythrin HHE cation binding domain